MPYNEDMPKPLLFSGRSHAVFSRALARALNVDLQPLDIHEYSDGETYVRILTPEHVVSKKRAVVVQSGSVPAHDHIIELLLLVDALQRLNPSNIIAVMPFLPYRRQEHIHEPGEGIGGELMMRLLNCAGVQELISADLHHHSFKDFFKGKLTEINALPVFTQYLKKYQGKGVVVAPDKGAIERAEKLAHHLNMPMIHIPKERPGHDKVRARKLSGNIAHPRAIIIDDEINTAGTILSCAQALTKRGVKEIHVAATHAVLSGPGVERLKHKFIREVVFADTIPIPKEKMLKKFKVLSLTPLFAKALQL